MATVRDGAPRQLTPAEIERHWFEHVYRGDREPQLTVRAAVMGMLLGVPLSLTNIYLGLKAGFTMGVSVTACVLAYGVFAALHRTFPRLFPPFGILENNAMQSCASAAALTAGAGLISAVPALMMLDPSAMPANHWYLALWIVVISMLGVLLTVPTKRQMINIEQLPFPDGIAAATTMESLHGGGDQASRQTRVLGVSAVFAAALSWFRDASWPGMPYPNIPSMWGTSWLSDGGYPLPQLTMAFEGSVVFLAVGAIVEFRQAWSLLLGAAVNYLVLVPMMLNRHVIATPSYPSMVAWSLWIGVSMLVTSGLLVFALQWKSMVRTFATLGALFNVSARGSDPMDRIEVPGSWFLAGLVTFGLLTMWLGHSLFHIAWWMGLIAVASCFLLVVIAARATGETNQTPTGALSKITQLTFGVLDPSRVATNLMTANITAGATAHAGDLLCDLKSGYLLGANPRQQFIAQFLGIIAGGAVVVPVFYLLVPDASVLGTARWPAPAAIVWKGIALVVLHGIRALHPTQQIGLLVGGGLGILLPLLERWLPRYRAFIPSATGLGIAFTLPGMYAVSMFLGGLIALGARRAKPALARDYTIPVASGFIAGESLMGVLTALLTIKGWLL